MPVGDVVKLGDAEGDLERMRLRWENVASIPETYATTWTALFRSLEIKAGQKVLIIGATSIFGCAAVNLGVQAGTEVTATTRQEERFEGLKRLGVTQVELEGPGPPGRLSAGYKFNAILELVGYSTLLESLTLVRGRRCLAVFLGTLAPIADSNPLLQMASSVHFSLFGSFVFRTPEFPLSDIPLK